MEKENLPGHSRLHWWDLEREFGIREVPMVAVYRLFAAQSGFHEHAHDCMEIRYLETGRQHYRIAGRDYALCGGEALVTYPGELHGSGHFPIESGKLFTLRMALPKSSGRFLMLTPRQAEPLVGRLKTFPNRNFRCDARMRQVTDDLLSLLRSERDSLSGIAVACGLLQWTLALLACAERTESAGTTPDIARALDFINAEQTRMPTLEALADVAGISKSRFNTKFSRQVGAPPMQYLLRHKIGLAIERLRDRPDRTITDIAISLGFSSSQYFATVFRRITHRAPSEYRPQPDA